MKAETSVFLTAIVLSFLALVITLYNVPLGAVELNPVGAFWIGSGLPFVGFIVGWIIVYAVFRTLIFSDRFKIMNEHKYLALGILLGVAFMDFLADFLGYIYIITL